MNLPVLMDLAVTMAVASCLTWPVAVQAYNMNRYGKQQFSQKQNRYGNPTWLSAVNKAGGWASSYGIGGGMMRHYPVSMNRYQETTGGGNRQNILSDDYYDSDMVSPYDVQRPYDLQRPYDRLDYAVVRYPSYGIGGYYPVDDRVEYDDRSDDQVFYENAAFGGDRDPVSSASPSSSYYPTAINRHASPMSSSPLSRYDSTRYPTDKIHKFRKVFMSNLVSPSNTFKSTKEQQLYNFWESLINGDLERMQQQQQADDDNEENRGDDDRQQQWADDQNRPPTESDAESGTSKLYQHLPLIFQQLQKQQKQKQHRQQYRPQLQLSVEQRTSVPPSPSSSLPSSSLPSSSLPPSSSSSSSSSLAEMSQTIPHGNLYKQWANGSPLIKRSFSDSAVQYDAQPLITTTTDNDDVRQLEKLKAVNTAANTTGTGAEIAATVPMADGGQREYVLPRPAGEKSSFESLLEVIAEGGLRGSVDENASDVVAYTKLRQEAKVNKKRSYVSDETSLAAQLGALRKN